MLIGFSVSNYKSFNETQSISLLASKVARHKEHVSIVENRRLLKSALVFGANAGGKSNLIKAVNFSRNIILDGLDKVNLNKNHFRINKEMYNQPGVFEYRIITNGKEYSYGLAISYSKREIVAEWLVRIENNGKEIYIYNREVDENGISRVSTDIVYSKTDDDVRMKIYLEDFGENISETFKRKTILSDIASRGNERKGIFVEISNVYQWFENIIIIFPNTKYGRLNEITSNDKIREIFSNLLSYFDTGIESVEGHQKEMDFDKVLENIPKEDMERIKIDISNKVTDEPIMFKVNQRVYVLRKDQDGNIVYNQMLLNHGNIEDLFEYADESDGTKRLFDLIPLFYESKDDCVILIDEIDRSLHTNLTKHFLELFYGLTKEEKSQLIVTTHDSNLLDLDMVRQDEIWFVERQKNHSSKIYSLNKFKARFDKKIDKEYLLGRYGAIPIFNEDCLESEADYDE